MTIRLLHSLPRRFRLRDLCVLCACAAAPPATLTWAVTNQETTPTVQAQKSETGKVAGDQKTQDKSSEKTSVPVDQKTKAADGKSATTPDKKPDPFRPLDLLASDFGKTWKLFAAEEGVEVQDVWQLREFEGQKGLICTGKPKGYLRTVKMYGDYKLSFQFRFPMDENGNSGVLLHIDGKDKIWPDGIQVQLHRPKAGSVFPSGNRKTPFTIGAQLPLHEVNKWNTCEIIVQKTQVYVTVNGRKVGPMQECNPPRGFIALQSEGSEVHFRNLILRPIRPETAVKAAAETAESSSGEKPRPSGT